MFADEVFVAFAPAQAYSRLIAHAPPLSWWETLRRPTVVLIVIGVASSIAATDRVTISGVASAMLLWTWVVLVQILAAALLIASARTRTVGVPVGIDLLFTGHLPWSLWIVGTGMWAASDLSFDLALAICVALIASVWTARIVAAFCRTALGTTRVGAWVRTVIHQALVWFTALWYVAWMSGGWFRLVE